MLKRLFITFLLLWSTVLVHKAQDSSKYHSLAFEYTYQFPGGDMHDRFLNNSALGLSYQYTSPKKWVFNLSGSFLFRDTVRENNILENIQTTGGYVIDGNGELADIFLFERAYTASFSVGKAFYPFKNKQWSLETSLGIGFLEHKILLQDGDYKVSQISGDYKKGYDRLSNGLFAQERIYFVYQPKGRPVSFVMGLEALQAFTKNRRSFNFDTMQKDEKQRLDLLMGPKISIRIGLQKTSPEPFYFR